MTCIVQVYNIVESIVWVLAAKNVLHSFFPLNKLQYISFETSFASDVDVRIERLSSQGTYNDDNIL